MNGEQPNLYRQLIRLAVRFSEQIDVGYTHCVLFAATSCHQKVTALRREGFLVVGTIPLSVNLAGNGYVEDFIMIKCLSLESRPVRRFRFYAILKS